MSVTFAFPGNKTEKGLAVARQSALYVVAFWQIPFLGRGRLEFTQRESSMIAV
jgi:hypothetical protein